MDWGRSTGTLACRCLLSPIDVGEYCCGDEEDGNNDSGQAEDVEESEARNQEQERRRFRRKHHDDRCYEPQNHHEYPNDSMGVVAVQMPVEDAYEVGDESNDHTDHAQDQRSHTTEDALDCHRCLPLRCELRRNGTLPATKPKRTPRHLRVPYLRELATQVVLSHTARLIRKRYR